jgi:catechol 2,3-dioxygenase-like lactoylglutathione lyase family enzyme
MIKYKGINHLAMATRDMGKTVRFWRDLLGMRLIAGLGRPGSRTYFFEIAENNLIGFFEWPRVEPLPEKDHGYPVVGPFAFDHVSLTLESRDDLWNLKDRLEAAGFWVSEAVDHGFIHSIYSFDPNGIPIEFSWAVEGVDLHKNPRMVDTSPPAIAREGLEPQEGVWPEVQEPTVPGERKIYPGEGAELTSGEKESWG